MYKSLLTIGTALTISACATQPEEISAAYVSPLQYQNYNCDQIRMELSRVTRQASDLHGNLKKSADNDEAQMAVGLLLLWPTLFFLEGGDGPQAQEYARLKGERDALEQSAIQKSCSVEIKPTDTKEVTTDKTS